MGAGFCLVVLLLVTAAASGNNGLDYLNNILQTEPETLCRLVTCVDSVTSDQCPENTVFMEGIAMFGCCGACIRFRQEGESCTGSIDPKYRGGYGSCKPNPEGGCEGDVLKQGGGYRSVNSSRARATTPELRSSMLDGVLAPNEQFVRSMWCDYYLTCGLSNTCDRNPYDTGCKYVERQYELAVATGDPWYLPYRDDYRWKPECTKEGYYKEKQCKGPQDNQRCVCVDPDGNRIYGDALDNTPEQADRFKSMNCKCSRRVWELENEGQHSVTLHCAENGNYEPMQCEDGWCYCIDPETASPYGSKLPEAAMYLLECYNKTLVGEQYLRRCDSEYHAFMELFDLLEFKGVQGPTTRLRCDPDGSYAPVQCNNAQCQCYDKYRSSSIKMPTDKEEDSCQGARDRWWYTKHGYSVEINLEINNGRYSPVQIRGDYAYCVDNDGIRSGPLVYSRVMGNLGCNAALSCQAGSGQNQEAQEKRCKDACQDCKPEDYVNYAPQS